MAQTAILPCDCTAAKTFHGKCGRTPNYDAKPLGSIPWQNSTNAVQFQDQRYGKGRRLHNIRVKDGKVIGQTCTVCERRTLN